MNKAEVMAALERMGTAQNRKVYGRHGAGSESYGVSFENIYKLRKQIGTDQRLAEELWATGNLEARILATYAADPDAMKGPLLERWVKEIRDHIVADAFAGLVARCSGAIARAEKWTVSASEFVGSTGWLVLAHVAGAGADLADEPFEKHLDRIESGIHSSLNRVRYAMNSALIAIGIRSAKLEKKALAAAKRIGRVEVDHGETGCKTPDAAAYIRKVLEQRAKKAAGAKPAAAKKKTTKKTATTAKKPAVKQTAAEKTGAKKGAAKKTAKKTAKKAGAKKTTSRA